MTNTNLSDLFDKIASQMEELDENLRKVEKSKQQYEESRSWISVPWDYYPILLTELNMELTSKLHAMTSVNSQNILLEIKINELTGRIKKLELEIARLKQKDAA